MPHKHRRADGDESQFDLPPTVRAAPLPVGSARSGHAASRNKKRKTSHVHGYGEDDTPKAFQRLMALSKGSIKKHTSLDNGATKPNKANKHADKETNRHVSQGYAPEAHMAAHKNPELRIQPGESMAEFRARVDQALPLSGVSRSSRKIAGLVDHRVTKHERRLKRLQKGWREEEARIREKEQEERELAEEEMDEHAAIWEDKASGRGLGKGGNKGKKKSKRKLVAGEVHNDSDDEWEALQRSRHERKGLHDVVSAPPTFDKVPREIFKVKNGAGAKVGNVPNAAGSLRKREQLGEERKTIIDTYRELMAQKKKKSG